MTDRKALEELGELAKNAPLKGRGALLRRALLVLAIPATAALATACYGAPMAQPAHDSTDDLTNHTESVDCDGDGINDASSLSECPH